MHIMYGSQIFSITGMVAFSDDPNDWDEHIIHLVTASSNGLFLDAEGEFTKEELIKLCGGHYFHQLKFVPMDDFHAKTCYIGDDEAEVIGADYKELEIKRIMDRIRIHYMETK